MTDLIVDSETLNKLRQCHERVEIRDPAGQLVGYFTPPRERPSRVSSYTDVNVPFTDEELDHFESEPGGRKLEDILTELERRS